MAFVSFDPTDSLQRLQADIDRFLNRPGFGLGSLGARQAAVYPLLNVFADDEGLVVRAEVPGVESEALDIQIESGRLAIRGERSENDGEQATQGSFHRRERPHGSFARSIELPDEMDTEKATAHCSDGVLTVRIPKRAELKPRRVAVSQG
jgi:HSP20 family protein